MTSTNVSTQAELDDALMDDNTTSIYISSDQGTWLTLSDNRGKHVVLWGNSSAELRENSSAVLRENSSAVLWGNSSAELWGNSSAELRENSSADASSSTSLHAYDRSRVTAGSHVAVHLHSAQAIVTGGALINLTALNLDDPATWANYNGVKVDDGIATLYKALDSELTAGQDYDRPTIYTIGETVTADDWFDNNRCGGGLHLSPTVSQATDYRSDATRWVRVEASLTGLRPINEGTAKCKVRTCRVIAEVDRLGRDLDTPNN